MGPRAAASVASSGKSTVRRWSRTSRAVPVPSGRALLAQAANEAGVPLKRGVYLFCTGPNFETPSEVRLFAQWGANAVGMSTVPECLAARHCGMTVAAVSLVTNLAAGLSTNSLTHEETLLEAQKAYGAMEKLLLRFFDLA